jgi:hypothetical protein
VELRLQQRRNTEEADFELSLPRHTNEVLKTPEVAAFPGRRPRAALSAELGPRHWNIDVVFRFVCDSLLEGDGFEPSVPHDI